MPAGVGRGEGGQLHRRGGGLNGGDALGMTREMAGWVPRRCMLRYKGSRDKRNAFAECLRSKMARFFLGRSLSFCWEGKTNKHIYIRAKIKE